MNTFSTLLPHHSSFLRHFTASTKMVYSNISLCLFLQIILVSFLVPVLGEPQVPCFFIFGDSLVDNGNNNNLQTTAKVNYWPYGIDFPAGPTGRFTNGRNIADFIAELLGFDNSIPPFSNATDQDILGGVNYGSGGAGILDQTGAFFGDVINMSEQLWNHKVTLSRVAKLVGGKRAAKKHLSSCIYSVGMGNNDYLANYLPQFYSSHSHSTPKQFADLLISQYSKQLRKLYNYGARKVAVFGVGKLGCVPGQVATYGVSNGSSCFETTNNIVQLFNEQLQLLINDLNDHLPNANFVYTTDNSGNVSYGSIKILSEACCATSAEAGGQCVPEREPCGNRDEYYFWDAFHPTEAASFIGAKIAFTHMSSLFYNPVHVW